MISQEAIRLMNVYVSKTASKYMKLKLTKLKREIEKCTAIARDFNTPLSELIFLSM